MWLSHHRPEQYDRCFRFGEVHVCRRCAVLYPLAFLVAGLSLAGVAWPAAWDKNLLYLLPLPVTLEFLLERFGALRYHPRRQIALTGQPLASTVDARRDVRDEPVGQVSIHATADSWLLGHPSSIRLGDGPTTSVFFVDHPAR